MGDITCPTCHEPWSSYHLRHDAIWDTENGVSLGPLWKTIMAEGKNPLKDKEFGSEFRKALEAEGWQFAGNSVLAFSRCPSCPKDVRTSEKAAERAAIADILDDDEDGLQVELEDYFG